MVDVSNGDWTGYPDGRPSTSPKRREGSRQSGWTAKLTRDDSSEETGRTCGLGSVRGSVAGHGGSQIGPEPHAWCYYYPSATSRQEVDGMGQETPGLGRQVKTRLKIQIPGARPGQRMPMLLYCHVGLFLRAGRDHQLDLASCTVTSTSPGLLQKQASRTPKGPIHNTDRPRGRRPYIAQPRSIGMVWELLGPDPRGRQVYPALTRVDMPLGTDHLDPGVDSVW